MRPIKRRTRVVRIFPNDAAIIRSVWAVLLEQHEHWQLEGRRIFSAGSQRLRRARRRPQVIVVAAPPRLHRPLQLTTHPRSNERLDKSIAPIHHDHKRRICTSGMTAYHFTLLTQSRHV